MNTKFRGQAEPSHFRDVSKPDQYIVTLRHSRFLTNPPQWLALSDTNKQIFDMRNIS